MSYRVFAVSLLVAVSAAVLAACGGGSEDGESGEERSFEEMEEAAEGTTVNFYLDAGDDAINAYVDEYVAPRVEEEHGIELRRTPISATEDGVNKLLNEKSASSQDGTMDLIWINGENFATGADADLWYGPWAEELPNTEYVDWESPEINQDFGYPVEGMEAPWGKAQFVMIYDSAEIEDPPQSMDELLAWTEENPGRFTYPAPPDFTGNAFVEHAFYQTTGEIERYQEPLDEEVFDEEAPQTWEYLNELEPNLWREGETYPESSSAMEELYANGEVWMNMSYNPQSAQRRVEDGIFPESTRTYVFEDGTLSNTHYVAVPFNSPNKAGAQVVANFLQSPEAQAEKQRAEVWGDLTALEIDRVPEEQQEELADVSGDAVLPTEELQENQLPEARAGWLLALEDGWQENVLR
ncbi:MAG: ABC transporter substrate-binding protein [Rubrobacter sp.]|nr:ABC transporter substrate-binding protein [Rubrobacter sp.]